MMFQIYGKLSPFIVILIFLINAMKRFDKAFEMVRSNAKQNVSQEK